MNGSEIGGARALREYATGERGRYSRVYLVDAHGPDRLVLDMAESHDAVLLPEGAQSSASAADVFRYSGRLDEPGDEMFLAECTVELQDYIAAAFVQLVGPTVVVVVDAAGRRAFLDDAELARRTGVFPSVLLDPRVVLANRSGLARPHEMHTPTAIRVRADGRFCVGMRGDVRGDISSSPCEIGLPVPRGAASGDASSTDPFVDDHPTQGRLDRYLRAADLLKMLGATDRATISGFGWRLLDDGGADAEPRASAPFLLRTPTGFVLAEVDSRRRRALSPFTAAVVDATQTSASAELAGERLAGRLAIAASDARRLCHEARVALGIEFGASKTSGQASKAVAR